LGFCCNQAVLSHKLSIDSIPDTELLVLSFQILVFRLRLDKKSKRCPFKCTLSIVNYVHSKIVTPVQYRHNYFLHVEVNLW
jgi:hypothetical protein